MHPAAAMQHAGRRHRADDQPARNAEAIARATRRRPTRRSARRARRAIAAAARRRRAAAAARRRRRPRRRIGSATARMNSRTVCTIAIARTSAPVSCASAIACASAPGAAREQRARASSQPCTNFRYAITDVGDGDHRDGERQHAERPGRHAWRPSRASPRSRARCRGCTNDDAADRRRHEHRPAGERGRRKRRRSRPRASRPASPARPSTAAADRREAIVSAKRRSSIDGLATAKRDIGRTINAGRSRAGSNGLMASKPCSCAVPVRRCGPRSARCAPDRRRSWRRAFP